MKLDGWEECLADAIEAARDRRFVWSEHDCCMFAAACVDAITGSSYVEQLRVLYTDEVSARQVMAAHGGLAAAVTAFLGESTPGWTSARRGDVCLVPTQTGDGLGVCTGAGIAVAAESGRVIYPLSAALAVWRI